jgi:hypothetical protein
VSAPRLGVDLGGVIMELATFHENGLAHARPSDLRELRGARTALRSLVARFQQVHVVSKCGPRTEELSRAALAESGFLTHTGITADHLHFCRQRADKAGICAELGITHFIDDRMEILALLHSVVPHRYLFGERPPGDLAPSADVTRVADWDAVLRELPVPQPHLPTAR